LPIAACAEDFCGSVYQVRSMQSLQTLVKRWHAESVEPSPPESTNAVQAIFAALEAE
jgi:hypothetical protein